MAEFDTATAYAATWDRYRNVLTADYLPPGSDVVAVRGVKVVLDHISRRDYQRAATGLELTGDSRPARIWNPTDEDLSLSPDGLLLVDDSDQAWLIRGSVYHENYGRWEATVEARRVDTDA